MSITQYKIIASQWLDRIIHQAIIDAIEIRRLKMLGRTPPEPERDETRQVYIVTLGIVYAGTILAAVAKWLESG